MKVYISQRFTPYTIPSPTLAQKGRKLTEENKQFLISLGFKLYNDDEYTERGRIHPGR